MPTSVTGNNFLYCCMRRHRGFTLIEIMVVVLIIVIILSMATLNFGSDANAKLREESERIVSLFRAAHEESILRGAVIIIGLNRNSYQFFEKRGRNLVAFAKDDILNRYVLPDGMEFSGTEIDGLPEDSKPQIYILPTGEITAFTLTLTYFGSNWEVRGTIDGDFTSSVLLPLIPA